MNWRTTGDNWRKQLCLKVRHLRQSPVTPVPLGTAYWSGGDGPGRSNLSPSAVRRARDHSYESERAGLQAPRCARSLSTSPAPLHQDEAVPSASSSPPCQTKRICTRAHASACRARWWLFRDRPALAGSGQRQRTSAALMRSEPTPREIFSKYLSAHRRHASATRGLCHHVSFCPTSTLAEKG
jgi:hypothetical protein